ncbi:MAG: archaeosine biosynthesis radical SAM protein RaSEA [Candidatus Jordarchaeum sp.]|uniref:archaeosine biosynthesis radical SAM protein RaSEA n=1 Tax=Candidatus Jordarchaeum sp. TaxID=2823881 RepID=UPI004048FBE0
MSEVSDSKIVNKIVEIRRKNLNKFRRDFVERPVKYWLEKDRLFNKIGSSLVVILATRGCNWALSNWGGCSMCGYVYDAPITVPDSKSLIKQFELAYESSISAKSPLAIKIFTSGSFFDEMEVPKTARESILNKIAADERIEELIVETRPEYVNYEILSQCREILGEIYFEVAIGLETSNDNIRNYYINKGFELKDFERAVFMAKNTGVGVKSYILIKPLFLREGEAIIDSISSAIDSFKIGVNSISFNPCTVHRGTLVEYLWKLGKYRPPWLWSIIEILKKTSKNLNSERRIICSLVGIGSKKGPHNCGKCDKQIRKLLNEFTLTQSPEVLLNMECDCKQEWLDYCEEEFI